MEVFDDNEMLPPQKTKTRIVDDPGFVIAIQDEQESLNSDQTKSPAS